MLNVHTKAFLSLINTTFDDIDRGVASPHHLHNVNCGIENIMSLLEHNTEAVETADQLSRRAREYVTSHQVTVSESDCGTIGGDIDRLHAAREALAGFCSAVEHSQPNSRVRTLGLAYKKLN